MDEKPWLANPDPSSFEEEWSEYFEGPWDGTVGQRFVPKGERLDSIGDYLTD